MIHKEPVMNDQENPLVSILIYNYSGQYLKTCLESIMNQDVLTNFEIILIDDASTDGSWDIAVEYAPQFSGIMTISRNKRPLGEKYNLRHCRRMAKGMFATTLVYDQAFAPGYVKAAVETLKSDQYARFDSVMRIPKRKPKPEPPSQEEGPLVSILCYNYNYGRYLRQSLESVFAQTYHNIELCFSDNASTDESWHIALEFARKYPNRMRLTRNRVNFGPDYNFANCWFMMLGKYFINFCSDDVLEPDYVERCVSVMEANSNIGMTIVNRAMIDDNGNRTEEPPFYNKSCVIPGEEQAAVYMMAGVNPSVSQIMYRYDVSIKRGGVGILGARYYGTRILDFNISLDCDVAFLKESLILHRIHSKSDTSGADSNLLPVIGLYVMNHQFADMAATRGISKATERLPASIDKLATLATRYSLRSLLQGFEQTALKYFHLAMAMNPAIATDSSWQQLNNYWQADEPKKSAILSSLTSTDNLAARCISYDPPEGSIPI